jgi:ATP-binding cassette subfamily F protein uup
VLSAPRAAAALPAAAAVPARPKSRLGYKDQRELDLLPREIESLETEQQALLARMSAARYHESSAEEMRADSARAGALEAQLARKFARWEQLEELRVRSAGG